MEEQLQRIIASSTQKAATNPPGCESRENPRPHELTHHSSGPPDKSCDNTAGSDWRNDPARRHLLRVGETTPELFRGVANRYMQQYRLPAQNLHSDGAQQIDYDRRDDWRVDPDARRKMDGMMSLLPTAKAETYAHLTRNDRLDIIAHGSRLGLSNKTAYELAQKLKSFGLKEVGIIKLQSCNVGRGHYLENLRDALQAQEIRVGYISAPRGYLVNADKPRHLVVNRAFMLVVGDARFKVVKGELDIDFEGTRYDKARKTDG